MNSSSSDEAAGAAADTRFAPELVPADRAVQSARAEPAEEAARRRERRLRTALQLASLGSWEWQVERNTVDWSDELYHIYGVEPGSFTPTFETYLERVHPDDRERVAGLIGEAVRRGGRFDFEERIVRPSGEIRLLRSVGECTCNSDGRVIALLGVCQDITEQRAMEEGLRRSEAAYRAMFELAGDAILVHDPLTGAIVDANHAACELHGYSVEEMRQGGLPLLAADPAAALPEEIHRLGSRAAAGEPQFFEWKARHRDGHEICFEVRLARIQTPDGDRLMAVARDVTERKRIDADLKLAYAEMERRVEERTAELARSNEALRAEALERQRSQRALAASEEHFRVLIENSSDMASILDATGTILYQSPAFERVLGWKHGELTGRKSVEFVHEEDRPAVIAELQKLAADPSTMRRVEVRYRHVDGSYRVLEAFGRGLKPDDPAAGIIVNSRDITERRRTEDDLRLQTAVLKAQGEASIDGILVVGPDGRILSWNQRFVDLWQIPEDIVEARSDSAAIEWVLDHLADPAAFVDRVDYLYAHPMEDSRDELVLRDGRVFDRYSGPVRSADGHYHGRIWWFRDITEQKRSQEALEQARLEAETARAQAERADLAKSEFLSRMSHELRTPLNSIIGFAQLLQRRELPADYVKPVEYILKGGRHLLNLINEVLEIARIESNNQRFSLEPVSVETVVQETLALIRPLAAERGLTLEVVSPVPGVFVRADRQRLTQVLLNLLSNAVKYSGTNAVIRVHCVPAPGDPQRIRIAIEDSGPGIPEDKRERLFTPFERLGAEQSGVEGTGLGLALSRRLVEGMRGTLDFETVVGRGSTFWAEFPLAADPVGQLIIEPVDELRLQSDPSSATAKILYVEDNLANLSLIESVLAMRPNIELISALQGRIGIELARQHAPDLVLLDLHLPDLAGEEVLARLRQDELTRHIPVIFITADATPGTAEKLSAAGAFACLTKPLDIDQFLATLDGVVSAREAP